MSYIELYKTYLETIGRPYRIYGSGKVFIACHCPSCNYDGKIFRQLWISGDKGNWGCWRCNTGGKNLVSLITYLESLKYRDAKKRAERFEKNFKIISEDQSLEDVLKPEVKLEKKTYRKSDYFPQYLRDIKPDSKAWAYLIKRGFDPWRVIKNWELVFCYSGRYAYRIMMPVYDPDGRYICAWQGRDITDKQELPYLSTSENESGVNIKNLILNIHRAESPIVLTEGYMDMMTVGVAHGTCVFGKRVSPEQMRILKFKKPDKIIVGFDGDATFEKQDLDADLETFTNSVWLRLPYRHDINSLDLSFSKILSRI